MKYFNPKSWVLVKHPIRISQQMGLLNPFLIVQSRERALYLPPSPSARTASVSICYSGLWGRLWSYFHPQSPYEDRRNEFLHITLLKLKKKVIIIITHTWSLTPGSSTEVIFGHEILSFVTENGRIGL